MTCYNFPLVSIQQIFLECQLMPDSGSRRGTQARSDLALHDVPVEPLTAGGGLPFAITM